MKLSTHRQVFRVLVIFLLAILFVLPGRALSAPLTQQTDNPNPPDRVVKLIFIHHSTGGNWLADPAENELGGDLGRALMENNYFISATNYGWGPDSIGDATDIPNWLDWFRAENSSTYLDALYNEDGQNFGDFGSWPRLPDDPGGENKIILFKSCFPNSALEGSPNDPPDPDGWLSVGHAKYAYNEILKYFATRPDKLFVVITAPPLIKSNTSPEASTNARAFNNWLVNDWLAENNYTLSNVAVFDFYNVLTGPDNHHRYGNGGIQHDFTPGMDNEYYPSGDDHPNAEGNRKATEEFIPLLNVYYHRWQAGNPQQPPAGAPPSPIAGAGQAAAGGVIDNFEAGAPAGTAGWEPFRDEATSTTITCAPASGNVHSGSYALQLDFNVTANSWASCTLFFDHAQDWSGSEGLLFYLRAGQAGLVFNIDIYAGDPDNQETYAYTIEAPPDSVNGWIPIELRWEDFHRVEWEANAGEPFDSPQQVVGMAFGFTTYPDTPNTGTIWVDDINLLGFQAPAGVAPTAQPEPTEAEEPEPTAEEEGGQRGLPCGASVALPLIMIGLVTALRRR